MLDQSISRIKNGEESKQVEGDFLDVIPFLLKGAQGYLVDVICFFQNGKHHKD
jgi:hypothetical protein